MSRSAEINLNLHLKQTTALETTATEVLFGGAAGGGKALAIDTPIATDTGWSTMGELAVGDTVFDERGQRCRVVAATNIMHDRPCYAVRFSDGSEIIADEQHQWVTFTASELAACNRRTPEFRSARRAKRPSRANGNLGAAYSAQLAARNSAREYVVMDRPYGSVRTTKEIFETLTVRSASRANHAISVAGALDCEDAPLLVDPYVLGAWLGDGTTVSASITCADQEILDEIAATGVIVKKRASKYGHGLTGGLQKTLRSMGVLGNKHIPPVYLRASKQQRLSLLQGLMDTDGCADAYDGACEISLTNKTLVSGVLELILSLGIKASIAEGVATLDGRIIGPKYRIAFLTDLPAFRLSRKLDLQKRSGFRGTHARRYVTGCERICSVPVRCIQVDSPSNQFLAGRSMIPTHNSFLMRVAAVMWCAAIPGLQVYLFRRLFPDLIKNHMEGPSGFHSLLAPWVGAGHVEIVAEEIRFWNGSKIYLCHCKDERDRFKYQGAEIHVLLVDELTHFTDTVYRFLRGRVRMVGIKLPPKFARLFPRILCSSNPGNVGHLFVKKTFIDPVPAMEIWQASDEEGGMRRQFIPALLEDNPSMESEDPTYRAKLRGLGSEALVRAMETGDWDVIEGAYFGEWDRAQHVIRPFAIPPHWTRFASFDWGSAKPFSVNWYAVSDGSLLPGNRHFPAGAMIMYREWYGASAPNVGLKMTVEQIADGILDRERLEKVNYRVADPACWKADGGPSHAERFAAKKVIFRPADNSRVAGWDQVRQRLIGDDAPMLYIFDACLDFIRCFPAAQHDTKKPEDVQTDGEDHCLDSVRYGCMSRPYTRRAPIELPLRSMKEMTMGEAWKIAKPANRSTRERI